MNIDKIALEVAIQHHITANFIYHYDKEKDEWDDEKVMLQYHKDHPNSGKSRNVKRAL